MKTYKLYILALLLSSLIATRINAQQLTKQSGYYHLSLGDFEVIALADGTVPVNASELLNHDLRIPLLLKKAFLVNQVETSINTYLIKSADRLILVDAGSGDQFGPQFGGGLLQSLKKAGFTPEQITDILITHIHLDHTGGLTVKGKIAFPNATVHINEKEIDFWKMHEKPDLTDTRGIRSNRGSYLSFKHYLDAGKVKAFTGNKELFPGITTYECAGHTAGHTVFFLESQGKKLAFWGDLIHIAAIQFLAVEIPNAYDFDQEKAAGQRSKAYMDAANGGYMVAADHISFPGIGNVRKEKEGYVWVPLNYKVN